MSRQVAPGWAPGRPVGAALWWARLCLPAVGVQTQPSDSAGRAPGSGKSRPRVPTTRRVGAMGWPPRWGRAISAIGRLCHGRVRPRATRAKAASDHPECLVPASLMQLGSDIGAEPRACLRVHRAGTVALGRAWSARGHGLGGEVCAGEIGSADVVIFLCQSGRADRSGER